MTELARPVPPPAVRSGVDAEIELAASQPQTRAAVEVLAQIWSAERVLPLTPELAWALLHAGNYVATARCDGRVVGAAVGFRGADAHGLHLHSHIAGVLPAYQGSSIGFALKQHQRSWALANGIDRITWTFDPLVGRNAYFNVVKLGAVVEHYYENFYGALDDDINSGDDSDRCYVGWLLDDPRVVAAAAGGATGVSADDIRAAGAVDILTEGTAGEPVLGDSALTGMPLQLCQLPRDIIALRASQSALAREWRRAVRSVLSVALQRGFELVTVTRDSYFVLAQPGALPR